MRYEVVDERGNPRETFDSQEQLLEELLEGAVDDDETLRSLYVVSYDDGGHRIKPDLRGDEFLRAATAPPTGAFAELMHITVPSQTPHAATQSERSDRSYDFELALIGGE
jgi:hypothetical protein